MTRMRRGGLCGFLRALLQAAVRAYTVRMESRRPAVNIRQSRPSMASTLRENPVKPKRKATRATNRAEASTTASVSFQKSTRLV